MEKRLRLSSKETKNALQYDSGACNSENESKFNKDNCLVNIQVSFCEPTTDRAKGLSVSVDIKQPVNYQLQYDSGASNSKNESKLNTDNCLVNIQNIDRCCGVTSDILNESTADTNLTEQSDNWQLCYPRDWFNCCKNKVFDRELTNGSAKGVSVCVVIKQPVNYQSKDITVQEVQQKALQHENKQKQSEVHVQIYAAVNEDLRKTIMDELKDRIIKQCQTTYTSITMKVEQLERLPTEDVGVPLIVVCINSSRLKVDVERALKDVHHSKTLVVAILHHQEEEHLPEESSKKRLCGTDYQQLKIVDIAYLTTKGIYPCKMNEQSFLRLVQFIIDINQS